MLNRVTYDVVRAALVACLATVFIAAPSVQAEESNDLEGFSIEELMQVEIFSVSKKRSTLADSAAAAYVLTQDDIRRSGATSIAEALQFVPGLEVASTNSSNWAITARGFNGIFANKLLVLIDGRSVYTPLFAGVYWDIQDTMLEDIERIEVIRGPGGSVWGANAVNGVINIITKQASATQGQVVSAGGGNIEHGFGAMRHGGRIGENGFFRIYGKYFDRDSFPTDPSDDGTDNWDNAQAGFRAEWDLDEASTLVVQGDTYSGNRDVEFNEPNLIPPAFSSGVVQRTDVTGGNLMMRFKRWVEEDNQIEFAAYFDRTERGDDGFKEDRNTVDITFQHNFRFWDDHDFVWGLGYRLNSDKIRNDFILTMDPSNADNPLFSAFFQDEVSLLDDNLRLIFGSKFEHNDFTGFEFQPSFKFLTRPTEDSSFWGGVSRAVRTPSRGETAVRSRTAIVPIAFLDQVDPSLPALAPFLPCATCLTSVGLLGQDNMDAEQLLAIELGYRSQISEKLSVDIAAYYNDYDDLRAISVQNPLDEPATLSFDPVNNLNEIWATSTNQLEAIVIGAEIAVDAAPTDYWRIRAGYTYTDIDLDLDGGLTTSISLSEQGATPPNQVFVRSMLDLPFDTEFDTNIRWVDRISTSDVDAYWHLDVRLGWHATDELEFSVVGQNLMQPSIREFGGSGLTGDIAGRVPRGVYGKVTWRR